MISEAGTEPNSSDRMLKMRGDLAALELHAMESGDPLY